MANWTVAQKKAAARIFAQALPSIHPAKSAIPNLSVIDQYWEPIRSSSPNRSVSSIIPVQNDFKTSNSDEFAKESGTTSDEVLFVLRFIVCVLLMSCMF